jgi:hypothetical protein
VFPQDRKARIGMTHANASSLRSAANAWRAEHGAGSCPTPRQLRLGSRRGVSPEDTPEETAADGAIAGEEEPDTHRSVVR